MPLAHLLNAQRARNDTKARASTQVRVHMSKGEVGQYMCQRARELCCCSIHVSSHCSKSPSRNQHFRMQTQPFEARGIGTWRYSVKSQMTQMW